MTFSSDYRPPSDRRRAAPWFVVEGVLLVLLGLVAAFLPGFAGVAGAFVFGSVLLLSGLVGLVVLLGAHRHQHATWGAVSAAIALVVGALIIWRPLIGAVALAMFIAAYLFIDAVALAGLALDQRRRGAPAWPLMGLAALIDFILALAILAMEPWSDTVLLGYIIAVDFIFTGIALITLGMAARSVG